MVRQIGMRMGTGITVVITEDAWRARGRRIKKMAATMRELTARLDKVVKQFESTVAELKADNARLEEIIADQRERLVDLQMEREDFRAEMCNVIDKLREQRRKALIDIRWERISDPHALNVMGPKPVGNNCAYI